MICYRILPLDVKECVEEQVLSASQLISIAKRHVDNANLMIIVNGKIVDSKDFLVKEGDEIVLVEEFLGG
ncbi:MAG: MoaD/ThiS family protein [Desulfurococcaceae archaeon]